MIAKGCNTIRALIETQYIVILRMIDGIVEYNNEALEVSTNYAREIAKNNSNGDNDVFHSILHNFDEQEDQQVAISRESRKILFCAIFAYYESMLNEILRYYNIITKATQVSQIIEAIEKEYKKRYSECLTVDTAIVHDFYRILRNYFMHGTISPTDLAKIEMHIGVTYGIKAYGNQAIDITSDDFLSKSLENVKNVLTAIEGAFSRQVSEEWKMLKRANESVSEAIKLYPPEYPGIETKYPPYCSIKVHKLILEAEKLYTPIAKRGNPEAQTKLAMLYLHLYEPRQKKKVEFWLKEAARQGYKQAIDMINDYEIHM